MFRLQHGVQTQTWYLQTHKRSLKKKEKETVQEYKCDICQKVFKIFDQLKANIDNHNKGPLICPKCYREYRRQDHFDKHFLACSDVLLSFVSETAFVFSNYELNNNEASPDLSFKQLEFHSYDHNFVTSSEGQDIIHEIDEMVDIRDEQDDVGDDKSVPVLIHDYDSEN